MADLLTFQSLPTLPIAFFGSLNIVNRRRMKRKKEENGKDIVLEKK
jgi:hypothetical protein